ncbi:MAG: hypothetical protein ACO1QB_01835 [Verrucomicrobiales bacterium]
MTEPSSSIRLPIDFIFAIFGGRNRRFTALWALLFLLGVCLPAMARIPGQVAPGVTRSGIFEQTAIAESSGLTASRRHPGVFWTHNDDGFPAFLFAVDAAGANLGSYEVKGANLIDFEAISYDEAGFLYLADIGTNGMARTHSAVHKAEEPNIAQRFGPSPVVKTWFLRFPDFREDCESFFTHEGYGYLIAKYPINGVVRMYRYNLANNDESILLEVVASIPVTAPVGDAAISYDKTRLALITDQGVYVIFIAGNPLSAGTAYRQFIRYENDLMEGGTFVPGGVLVSLEGSRDLLLFNNPFFGGAPGFSLGLTNQAAFTEGRVEFNVAAFGFPVPAFVWRFNGSVIPGQTGPRLVLPNITLAHAGRYEVTISNANGTATTAANLTVAERTVDVRITELMAGASAGTAPTADWWELTSFDTNVVNLSGWRFNDSVGGLSDAFVIPPGVSILPGESIIFVENITSNQFKTWWGPDRFSPQTKIITYAGSALSFRLAGDALRIWEAKATEDFQVYTSVSFGQADVGVSFNYDIQNNQFGVKSILGVNGVFRAATGSDIGSPGRTRDGDGGGTGTPISVGARVSRGTLQVSFDGESGRVYTLEASDNLNGGSWTAVAPNMTATTNGPAYFQVLRDRSGRFFRVRRN